MKKTLLIIMTVTLCSSLMAQVAKVPVKAYPAKPATSLGVGDNQGTNVIPKVRSSAVLRGGLYDEIGETYYNLPTNTNSRNLLAYRPKSGDLAAVWTMAKSVNSRGTGLNYYFENGSWGVIPDPETGRIEDKYCGWGTHGFTDEGEIIVAHLGSGKDGMIINTRDKWGEGDWKQTILPGPEYLMKAKDTVHTILWPSLVTNGNTVHMICVTDQNPPTGYGYLLKSTVLLYYRSQDGGKTWDIQHKDFTKEMTEYEVDNVRGDVYTLAVKGDHVVFVYSYTYGFINYMESKDGGETWQKKVVYEFDDFDLDSPGYRSPRVCPASSAIFIDENDKVHIAFTGNIIFRWEDTPEGYINSFLHPKLGVIYWNEDHDPITLDDMRAYISTDGTYMYMDSMAFEKYYFGYIPCPSVLGYDQIYRWVGGADWELDQFRRNGLAAFPRLFVHNGKVYLSYQSLIDCPLNFSSEAGDEFYRGIFLTVSLDNGNTWDIKNTSWLSYNPNLFWVDDSDWAKYVAEGYPKYEPDPDDPNIMRPVYPDIEPYFMTENAYPTMSLNMSTGGEVMLMWMNRIPPFLYMGPDASPFEEDPMSVYTFHNKLSAFPEFNNIDSVWRGKCNDNIREHKMGTINTKIYPNPASGKATIEMLDITGLYTLTITNIMGQVLTSMNGNTNRVELNFSNYAPGIYIVNIRTANAVTSQKLIVR